MPGRLIISSEAADDLRWYGLLVTTRLGEDASSVAGMSDSGEKACRYSIGR
jgi:hypothetical protein